MQKQSPILPVQDPTPQLPLKFHLKTKQIILDETRFQKSLVTHHKTSKSATYETNDEGQIAHKHLKECQKALKTQKQLSKLHFALDIRKNLENKLLLPTLKHCSSFCSLSLRFSGDFNNDPIPHKALCKILAPLKNLSHLDLTFCFIVLNDVKILKNLMKNIRKLRKVFSLSLAFLSCSGLTSHHYNIILSNLPKVTQLCRLKLSFDDSENLLNADIENLTSFLPKLSHLIKIDLSFLGQRTILEPTLLRLFKAFQSLKNLSNLTLNLQGCGLTYLSDQRSILASLNCLIGTSIQKLNLSLYRNFGNRNLQQLSQVLKELILLKSLSLNLSDWHTFSDETISDFGSALACMPSLTSLDISFPSEMDNKNIVETMAFALMSLQGLVSLKLDFRFDNGTKDQQFQTLFANLKSLRSLKHLDIQVAEQQTITDISLETLGESLKELSLLRSLSLNFSPAPLITAKGVEAIFSGIQEGPLNLFKMSLKFENNENINEKTMSKLGETLQVLGSLYSVDLSFRECSRFVDFKDVFHASRGMKNLEEITLSLPDTEENSREVRDLAKIKNVAAPAIYNK